MPKVRPAVPGDLRRIAELTELSYRPWAEILGYPPFPVTADHAEYVSAGLTWLAENEDGAIPALIEMELEPGAWGIFNVAVDPAFQGRGLGHLMLDFAEREGISRGFAAITLYTNRKMIRNIELYRRRGYAITAERENPKRPGHFIVDMKKKFAGPSA
ncbi:GNAT family N-acetyltransferase [Nisaea sediminum]|uniref:GNAT family N-acetyltransferase n=1 Tax=Nisaea sediminum TaxID=2775867 RepID=UPI00186682C6|nr:GNAT family N-acetyltransferase [Nisaea sediminum]